MPGGPRFLEEDDGAQPTRGPVGNVPKEERSSAPEAAAPATLRQPVFLEPEPEAEERLDVGWAPKAVETLQLRVGTGLWVASGLCVLIVSWAVLSLLSFVLALFVQSAILGLMAMLGIGLGCVLLLYAMLLEVRAYRSLGTVERLRTALASSSTTIAAARTQAYVWLNQLGSAVPDRAAVERLLQGAATTTELRSILRSQVADRLREKATAVGRQAAIEGATLVAICPHPAWDGVIAGGRGLLVIRRVAALYGLRPGLTVTLALLRRVAWTAAGTTGISLVSQGLADHVLSSLPGLKHVAAALPGTGVVAVRLYRLAGVTAETCSPLN